MTRYHIEIGYLSAGDPEQAWQILVDVVQGLREQPNRIIGEALRIEGGSMRELIHFAEQYSARFDCDDATLRVIQPLLGRKGSIMQLASGGGLDREIKEKMRRAFSRLVIAEMHNRRIEVNLRVA